DNIGFSLRHADLSAAQKRERVSRALQLMGLGDFGNSYPAQLSGGMRQRVCIARTLVLEPRLILLDEPFGALDQQTRLLMGDEVLALWRATGATVLLITHSLDEATLLSDRVGFMSARPGRFLDIIATNWPRERDSRLASAAVKLEVPVMPRTFYCAGLNYTAHVIEQAQKSGVAASIPSKPDIGYRAVNALIAHGENVVIPRDASEKVQYEGELVAVI